jgi:hypothetical protein
VYELLHGFEIHLIQNDGAIYPNLLNLDFSKDVDALMINGGDNVNKYEKVD